MSGTPNSPPKAVARDCILNYEAKMTRGHGRRYHYFPEHRTPATQPVLLPSAHRFVDHSPGPLTHKGHCCHYRPLSFSELTKPLERVKKTLVPSFSNEGYIPAKGQEGTWSHPALILRSDAGLLGDCLLVGFVTAVLRSYCPTKITDIWGGSRGRECQP